LPLVVEEAVLVEDQEDLVDLVEADQELVVVLVQETNGHLMLLVSLVPLLVKVIMVDAIATALDLMVVVAEALVVLVPMLVLALVMVELLLPTASLGHLSIILAAAEEAMVDHLHQVLAVDREAKEEMEVLPLVVLVLMER
jgi:hypothetical protein